MLAGILDTGVLDHADQDRLANELLWSDKVRYEHPLGWIGSTFIEFDLDPPRQRRARRPRKVHVDPSTPVTTERHVWPPSASSSEASPLPRTCWRGPARYRPGTPRP